MKKIIFLCTLFLIVSCTTTKKITPTPSDDTTSDTVVEEATPSTTWAFQNNNSQTLDAVLTKAKAEHKLVFMDAYATWCAPCKLMDKEVFTHSPTADFFNKNFISYKVNIEKNNGETLKLLYDISVLPTLLFLDANGKVLVKQQNSVTISGLKALANQALSK
jgi:thioredoxin 1